MLRRVQSRPRGSRANAVTKKRPVKFVLPFSVEKNFKHFSDNKINYLKMTWHFLNEWCPGLKPWDIFFPFPDFSFSLFFAAGVFPKRKSMVMLLHSLVFPRYLSLLQAEWVIYNVS